MTPAANCGRYVAQPGRRLRPRGSQVAAICRRAIAHVAAFQSMQLLGLIGKNILRLRYVLVGFPGGCALGVVGDDAVRFRLCAVSHGPL